MPECDGFPHECGAPAIITNEIDGEQKHMCLECLVEYLNDQEILGHTTIIGER